MREQGWYWVKILGNEDFEIAWYSPKDHWRCFLIQGRMLDVEFEIINETRIKTPDEQQQP